MKRSQVFPSNYLGKDDVPHPMTYTITDVRMETVKGDNGEEEKAVMHFLNHEKGMILNNTNWTTLEEAYGDDSDYWRGKQVEIYIDPGVMFGGKRVGGVRVRVPTHGGQSQNGEVWSWEQALAEAAKVGCDKDYVVGHLKAEGKSGWNNHRDTASIQALIRKRQAQQPQETAFTAPTAPPADDIPFSWLIPIGLALAATLIA